MKLSELISGAPDIEIKGVKCDSREVERGDLFICIKGERTDGHLLAPIAVKNGAEAIVCERALGLEGIYEMIVPDTHLASAYICSAYYSLPQDSIKMVGVTGTNGKTSTAHILREIFEFAKVDSALIGTLGCSFGGNDYDTGNTTPLPSKLYKLLRKAADSGVKYAFAEVSSHAISLGRVAPISFEKGIYTNLSPEHLDYHKNMYDYAKVKESFFKQCKMGYFNADDEYSYKAYKKDICQGKLYGLSKDAHFRAENIIFENNSTKYSLFYNGEKINIKTQIPGLFGVYNTLAAAAVSLDEGIGPDALKDALSSIKGAKGRMEIVYNGKFTVIIDYAHTPDALNKAIDEVNRAYKDAERITLVFGCGGDRDKTKRPIMGRISKKADRAIITSDNCRYERAEDIIEQIRCGNPFAVVIKDRKSAIEYALKSAIDNEVVLVAGKGHEEYELTEDKKSRFSEREIITEVIKHI